jgi:cell division protein ZapA (FtsZ GTPase activity inhibitor)
MLSRRRRQRYSSKRTMVFVVIDGNEYRVNDDNGMATELIAITESFTRKADRLSMLDIHGLGILKYRNRRVHVTSNNNIIYRLKFDQWRQRI